MSVGGACPAASARVGEWKGPILVWLVLTAFGTAATFFVRFAELTLTSAILGAAVFYGFTTVFLVGFVSLHEKRRLRTVFASLGLRKAGAGRSLEWALLLFPAVVGVSLAGTTALSLTLGPLPPQVTHTGSLPPWVLWFTLVEAFFPVAIVEEMYGRGYLLDRLMPTHPARLREAGPAILVSAVLFALWHVASYLQAYQFSVAWTVGLIGLNVFPLSVVVGVAYVRSRTQNIAGVILLHFLLDALPVVAALVVA